MMVEEYKKKLNRKSTLRGRKLLGGAWFSNVKRRRKSLIMRYGDKCNLCQKDLSNFDNGEKTLDHIIPVSLGGSNFIENLQILCRQCHLIKTLIDNGLWELEKSKLLEVKN